MKSMMDWMVKKKMNQNQLRPWMTLKTILPSNNLE